MGSVSVSRDALQRVKAVLGDFQTSMDSTIEHMKTHAEEAVIEVRNALKRQQALVDALEGTVARLGAEIEQLQTEIINNNKQIDSLDGKISAAKVQISGLDRQASQLQTTKQRLLSLGSEDDNNGGYDNRNQIDAVEIQIKTCDNQRRRLNEQIASMQGQKNDLNRQNIQLRDEKTKKEAELSTAKGELKKAHEKNEKMKSAGNTVESKVGDLLSVVQRFKQNVTTTSSTTKSGIEKCIAAVDEYMATNLGQRAYADSMNTPSDMSQMRGMDADGEFDGAFAGQGSASAVDMLPEPAHQGNAMSSAVQTCTPGEYHFDVSADNTHHAYGQLTLVPSADRPPNSASLRRAALGDRGRHGEYGSYDDAGHIIGNRFAGTTIPENIFPQEASLNRYGGPHSEGAGEYQRLENEWERLLSEGNQVYVDIYASSATSSDRQDSIYGSYVVVRPDGTRYMEVFSFTNESVSEQESWESEEST